MQCCRVSPDVLEAVTFIHLFPKRAIFLLELPALHGSRDQQLNLVEVERLGHKIVGAAFHCFHCDIDRPVSRHHDTDRGTRHFQSAIDQGHSIFAAETQIGEKHIDLLAI